MVDLTSIVKVFWGYCLELGITTRTFAQIWGEIRHTALTFCTLITSLTTDFARSRTAHTTHHRHRDRMLRECGRTHYTIQREFLALVVRNYGKQRRVHLYMRIVLRRFVLNPHPALKVTHKPQHRSVCVCEFEVLRRETKPSPSVSRLQVKLRTTTALKVVAGWP